MRLVSSAIVLALIASAYAAAPSKPAKAPSARPTAASCTDGAKPKTLEDYVRRGDCLRETKQFDAAIAEYRHGLELRPAGSRDLHLGMALAYRELSHYEDMYSSLQAALQLDARDPEALYWMGIAYEETHDYPSALQFFRKVLTIRPTDNRAQRDIGFVLLQQNELEAALEALEAAVRMDSKDWRAHLYLAEAYKDAGDTSAGDHRNMIPYHAKYVEHAREAARLNPDDYDTQYGLGTSLLDDRDASAEAIEALQRAAALRPDEYRALRNLAIAQQRADLKADAYETCKKLLKLSTIDKWLYATMGQLEDGMGRDQDAEKSYRAALRLDDTDWELSVSLAKVIRRQGRGAEAKVELEKAKGQHPELASAIDGLFWQR